MRRIFILFLVVSILVSLVSCSKAQSTAEPSEHVIYPAWTGEYSDTKFKKAISKYEKDYSPLPVRSKEEAREVTITVGDIDSYRTIGVFVVRKEISELKSVLDCVFDSEYDQSTGQITFDVSDWYFGSKRNPIYSILVRTTKKDEDKYLYFRIEYYDSEDTIN